MAYFGSFIFFVVAALLVGSICETAPVSRPEFPLDRTTANVLPTVKVSLQEQYSNPLSDQGLTLRAKNERVVAGNTRSQHGQGIAERGYTTPSSLTNMKTPPHSDTEEPCWSYTLLSYEPEMLKPCTTTTELLQSKSQIVGDALGTFTVRTVQTMLFIAGVFFVVVGVIRLKNRTWARMSGDPQSQGTEKGEGRGTWIGLVGFKSLFDSDHSGDFFSVDVDEDDNYLLP